MKAGTSARCPDCGTELPSDGAIAGLCPQCLFSMALQDSDPDLEELATLEGSGRILGERYQMRELLGRGGMGEVWRAFDLKLRVDVALKSIRPERAESESARELLRREVRSAREVVSPNVCRIFDLVVEGGRELVSMEYIDGTTLAETLKARGPLELQEAREIAAQFLSGLEAIHQAGLVHRDFKPENVMLTRAGRVVVMDFGLAKARTEGKTGTISGTPAYMAPEQARGQAVDARADVFSAGVVLAEMLAVGGEGGIKARQALWQAVREVPLQLPEGPWAGVLRQALDPQPDRRYASARALAHALEEVTLRLPGFEQKRPYPGLASFTEEDAEYFFGREVEVEAVWKKLKRPRLLALIGPSGAGKSSFLRAGLLATLPKGWTAVVSTPGSRPFQALARALVPAFSGDTEAMQEFLRFDEPDTAVALLSRWRKGHEQALVIVDQFEELFTLNPAEVQESFAQLLGRLVLEADLHVLLSMRDDFLFHCHVHEALAPILSEVTLLGPLNESGLRRALVQPALACGYRYEDESLVEEMVSEVGRERGALPLLAFAASRLWEKRDREPGLLTRVAYQEIGGVAGALAQHAEATLESIGTRRAPLVREVFRNLVTAQGTRAAREREELLSVFETTPKPGQAQAASTPSPVGEETPRWSRKDAGEVLDALIDARLLTSYERPGDEEGRSRHHVEIIHESLLGNWPRLVRWQTQDQDGALLRDQLRQAAQAWHERGRPEDLLWSGTAYRDFALWRERYPGGLTATEDAFAEAATRLAGRRRRRRRAGVAAILTVAVAVAAVTSGLWRRSETSRQKAEAETLRAEASKLLALGQVELDKYPTAALAYALKSLELMDGDTARLFALRAIQRGPTATVTPGLEDGAMAPPAFSPNGDWLAFGGWRKVEILRRKGGDPLVLGGDFPEDRTLQGESLADVRARAVWTAFGPASDVVVANRRGAVRVWSIPEGRELRREAFEEGSSGLRVSEHAFLTFTTVGKRQVIRSWPLGAGDSRPVGTMEAIAVLGPWDAARGWLAYARGRKVFMRSLDHWLSPPRLLAEHSADIVSVAFSPDGRRLAALDHSGEIRLWPAATRAARPLRVLKGVKATYELGFDLRSRWLARLADEGGALLWDLTAPPGAQPIVLRRADAPYWNGLAFEPSGRWLATANAADGTLWSIGAAYPHVLAAHEAFVTSLAFTPDGKSLVSTSPDGTLKSWPLSAEADDESRVLVRAALGVFPELAVDSASRHVVLVPGGGRLLIVPLEGAPVRELEGLYSASSGLVALQGDLVAVAPVGGPFEDRLIRIVDLRSGAVRFLPPVPGVFDRNEAYIVGLQFLGRDRLLASVSSKGLLVYDLDRDSGQLLAPQVQVWQFAVSPDGHLGVAAALNPEDTLLGQPSELLRFHVDGTPVQTLRSHGNRVGAVALSPDATRVATASVDGTIRIGLVSGEEPHLFFGHEGIVTTMAFSPDGRWVASGGHDGTVRLWPVPDVLKEAPHTWERERFLAMLRSQTNLRAVSAPKLPSGWKLERGPFPGWAKVPEW